MPEKRLQRTREAYGKRDTIRAALAQLAVDEAAYFKLLQERPRRTAMTVPLKAEDVLHVKQTPDGRWLRIRDADLGSQEE